MLKLYNTASRKLETFKPARSVVKIYTCGPTVYSEAHIGNLTAYIYWDLLIRTLKANGYQIKRVLNLTDVGHLVSDGDEGEDKLEKSAAREGKSVYEIAEHYIDKFRQDYTALELLAPEIWARATDYINEDMQAVDKMTANGFTYETTDGVYYDTTKFNRYADFARLDLAGLKAGKRVEFSSEKKNVADFAVWKFIKPGEKHAMRWDYLGRPGYPGWHLECTTIIHKELGEPIDIHCGGIDHIPVHHTNEIAECYAAYGSELSRYWLHCDFITVDGKKISKSLGNTFSLADLAKRGFSPMDYKMWVLSGHYQGTRNFTFESLEAAKQRRLNWRNKIALSYQNKTSTGDGAGGTPAAWSHQASTVGETATAGPVERLDLILREEKVRQDPPRESMIESNDIFSAIINAVNHNLNSAEAFSIIDTSELSMEDWQKIDELFGLRLITDSPDIDGDTREIITARQKARKTKNYAESDRLRDLLAERGISILDTANGPIWQYTI